MMYNIVQYFIQDQKYFFNFKSFQKICQMSLIHRHYYC